MKQRPILMSAPMVRAILREDGPKTQTRRPIKLQTGDTFDERALKAAVQEWRPVYDAVAGRIVGRESVVIRCPYGEPCDRLYVRETWSIADTPCGAAYRADCDPAQDTRGFGWRASTHMPRWASRITLEITDVRVQRLTDISEADALAEGVRDPSLGDLVWSGIFGVPRKTCPARTAFAVLWEDINGRGSWEANPWVWALTFRRVEGGKA